MKLLKSITLISVSTALLLGAPQENQDAKLQKTIELGNSSSALLLKTLGQNMKAHMEKGGVMDALNFCTAEAYTLTQKVNSELPQGLEVKRISLKYRNPANQPTEDEKKILESFDELSKKGVQLPQYVLKGIDKNTYKYYKPIIIDKEVCLACHGDISKNVELTKAINDKYPQDKALGYNMNDIRGAVLVTIKH